MAEPKAPSVLVFDVNETLLDVGALGPLFLRLFGEAEAVRDWFAELVLHAQAVTLAGHYLPFAALGGAVLRMVGEARGITVEADDMAELKARTLALPAHADVLPGLARLRGAGFRLVTLTNSAPDPHASALAASGIAPFLERQFSVDAVARFKPAPEVYRQVAEALGLAPGALCLVAAHAWDVLGAQAVGWSGALLTRPGHAPLALPSLPGPDLVAPDLVALAEKIERRWR